jgi:hypothetical protein
MGTVVPLSSFGITLTNSGTDGTDPNSARTYRMPLVGQQHDVRCMTTIGVTSSVPEFLSALNLLMQ